MQIKASKSWGKYPSHNIWRGFWLLGLGLWAGLLSAQRPNVLILGQISGDTLRPLRLGIDKRYFSQEQEEYQSGLTETGKFAWACYLEFGQLAQLKHRQAELDLWLKPGDTLELDLDERLEKPRFGGSGGADNRLWQAWRAYQVWDQAPFAYTRYRKPPYEFAIHQSEDAEMRRLEPAAYLRRLNQQREEGLMHLQSLLQAEPQASPELRAFIRAEIESRYTVQLGAYTQVYGGRHRLDSSFLAGQLARLYPGGFWQNDSALGHALYREALQVQSYYYGRSLPDTAQIAQARPYHWAGEALTGLSRSYTQVYWLEQGLRRQALPQALYLYEDFLSQNPYAEFDQIPTRLLHELKRQAPGSAAPLFSLPDSTGQMIGLERLRGQWVYLDFWASWCKPCLRKLQSFQPFLPRFAEAGIEVLYINLDKDPALWLRTIRQQGWQGGRHLHHSPHSLVSPAYEVVSVPRFFIIDKAGNFAPLPQGYGPEAVLEHILKLDKAAQ